MHFLSIKIQFQQVGIVLERQEKSRIEELAPKPKQKSVGSLIISSFVIHIIYY